jgi:hypothetical protein
LENTVFSPTKEEFNKEKAVPVVVDSRCVKESFFDTKLVLSYIKEIDPSSKYCMLE